MTTYRLFNMFVVIAVIVIVALTVREAAATSSVVSKANADQSLVPCDSLPSRYSIHSEYVEEMDAWMPYSENGPTGLDGGLVDLLSAYRTCR